MRAVDAFTGAPNPATLVTSTSPQFVLQGGKYWFGAVGTFNSGSFALQKLMPDGTSLTTLGTALTTTGGNVNDYPPGTYQVTVSGSTTAAVWWEVVRVPEE